jgi:hypothetical protein
MMIWAGLAVGRTYAQPQPDEVDRLVGLVREDLRAQKADVLARNMSFTATEAAAFWPIYKEYEAAVAKLGDEKYALIKDYAAHIESLDDAKAKQLTESALDLEGRRLALLRQYLPRFEAALAPKRAARFCQVELQINRLIDLQIAAQVPLVR